jgi:hypothetical protein
MRKPDEAWGVSHGKSLFGPEAGPARTGGPPLPGGPPDRSEASKRKVKASLARLKKTNDTWRANRNRRPGIGA